MNKVLHVLAIDPGAKMGWALYQNGKITSGMEDLTPKRQESIGIKFLRLEQFLQKYGSACNLIVFEEVRRHLGTAAAHAYGGFKAIILKYCHETNKEFTSVPVQTLKAFALNTLPESDRPKRAPKGPKIAQKGPKIKGSSKEGVLLAAERKWGRKMDDNECDARFLLTYTLKEYYNIEV